MKEQNPSKFTLLELLEASRKLLSIEAYYWEMLRPICWMAANFQSLVLEFVQDPPIDFMKLLFVSLVAAVM
jgi:hypothetical protein